MKPLTRRLLLTAAAAAWAGAGARAQQAGRVYRIGVFDFGPVSPQHPNAVAFFDELRERGYVQGRNLIVERVDAGSQAARLAEVAQQIVAWKPDLITASGSGPNLALKAVTSTVPIVMTGVGDPVGLGLVASLAHPGGNFTGVTPVVPGGFVGKQLQLLQEAVPAARRVAIFGKTDNPALAVARAELMSAAPPLGMDLRLFDVPSREDIDAAIAAARKDQRQAVLAPGDAVLNSPAFAQAVTAAGLPLMSLLRRHAEAGGLMSYGPDFIALYRRAAVLADRLLRGERAADMPIEQPTRFELVLNLDAAKRLGLAFPQSLLLRADEVIR